MDWLDGVYMLKWFALLLNFVVLAYAVVLSNFMSFLKSIPVEKDILLITAHPDDEAMFFLPMIKAMKNRFKIHLLCLSSGNADGLGEKRTQELADCTQYLGIQRHTIVNDENL